MKRHIMSIATVLILVFALASLASAVGDGNARKGKFLYRKHCRVCHGKDACDLSPATLTQAEWSAKFEDPSLLPCYNDWPEMQESDINDIFSYLHDYAKDSPSPAKCS